MAKIIAALAAIVVVGAGAYYFLIRTDDTPRTEDIVTENDVVQRETDDISGSGSLKSLLTLGQNLSCDFTYDDPESDNRTEGTTYLAGTRMRGDFTMEQGGETYVMSTIHDGEYVYTWGEGPTGAMAIKFAIDESDTASDNETVANDPLESDDAVDYTCTRWSVDTDMFVPPSDIEFQDFGAQFGQMRTDAGDLEAAQCAACDQAPAEARTQCRAALGCE